MRTIIDITQLAGWQGKLTGIPRVMYELSSRYAGLDEQIVFIGWDAGRQVFWEIPFGETERKRSQVETAKSLEAKDQISTVDIKQAVRTLYSISPDSVKGIARHARAFVGRLSQSVDTSGTGFMFEAGDNLLILWGEWGDVSYRRRLVEAINKNGVNLYQMVHDMLPLITPQYSSHSTDGLTNYATEIYPLCRQLISVSENTKKDVYTWLHEQGLKVPEIKVVRLGDNFEKSTSHQPDNAFFASYHPYIVCVGTIETRKNHTLLYYVYKLAKARDIALPPLVVVGRRGWLTENIYDLMTNDPDTKDLFVFLHDASDEELSWIYDHSLFSVYPSHYEGWGLPVAESIAHGVPCIASNTSSIPEIAGDLIPYFSPTSTDECLQAICGLLDDKTLSNAKQKISAYRPTSWDETFAQIRGIIGDTND